MPAWGAPTSAGRRISYHVCHITGASPSALPSMTLPALSLLACLAQHSPMDPPTHSLQYMFTPGAALAQALTKILNRVLNATALRAPLQLSAP